MEIIAQERWSYTLYKDDERHVISVICGSVGVYEVAIELNDQEINKLNSEHDFIKSLSLSIRNNPDSYKNRKIAGFTANP